MATEREKSADEKPFIEHLEELRLTLFKMLAATAAATIVCIAFSRTIFAVLMRPLKGLATEVDIGGASAGLIVLGPQKGFMVIMITAVIAGIILSSPLWLYFIGQFILPALRQNEKRVTIPALAVSLVLFLCGVAFCYWITLPLVLKLLWKFNEAFGFKNMWVVNEYLSMVTKFMIANGLIFEMPLVLLVLVKLGVVSPTDLRAKRKYAIFTMFILGAMLSPPDLPSMIMVSAPMIILYEASVRVAALMEKKEEAT